MIKKSLILIIETRTKNQLTGPAQAPSPNACGHTRVFNPLRWTNRLDWLHLQENAVPQNRHSDREDT